MNGMANTFQYDGLGRRIGKTIGSNTTTYLYDGPNVVQELDGSPTPVPTANLLTGLEIDEVFTRTTTGNEGARNFLTDALGNTTALTDSAQAFQTTYTYEPFGKTTSLGAASTNTYQYTGRENDGTELYFYRARYYHPKFQRFISEDPLEFDGGDTNLYAYVGNDPLDSADPFGLRPLTKCEKDKLGPYIPKRDLDAADLHTNIWPPPVSRLIPKPLVRPFLRNVAGLTLDDDIYLRPGVYDPSTADGIALLGHELVHVGQYNREGLTRSRYLRELLKHGSGPKNKYEKPAYDKESQILSDLLKDKCPCP